MARKVTKVQPAVVVLPRLSTQFKKYAPQAKFVMFERSGHYPFIEENQQFIKTMEDFLK